MAETINGVASPQFVVLSNIHVNSIIHTYTFPLCGIGGIEPSYTKDAIVTELESGELVQEVFGYRGKFILDYSLGLKGDHLLNLGQLLNYEKQKYTILFLPHRELTAVRYKVIFSNAPLIAKLLANNGQFVMMKGLVIELIVTTLEEISWVSSDLQTHAMSNLVSHVPTP